ncbi:hypothetical protein DOTSEDRAFT_72432 [Dothistroma septosporum NZE10]|uniref:Uncharacterized protein n=1 Tax=Dothistroma septosporum (strain NZE10 / CBS 128990) TaxID=675120 RepID=M2WLW2_DOTSN|nr:hypothetical protein DOTSEDRAFT_72432 [Dothistroma septosporum NZE10]
MSGIRYLGKTTTLKCIAAAMSATPLREQPSTAHEAAIIIISIAEPPLRSSTRPAKRKRFDDTAAERGGSYQCVALSSACAIMLACAIVCDKHSEPRCGW